MGSCGDIMRVFIIWSFVLLGCSILPVSLSLALPPGQAAPAALPFQFLTGEWKGEGWHKHPDGRVNEFKQTYSFVRLAHGQVIAAATKAVFKTDLERVLYDATILFYWESESEARIGRRVARSGTLGPVAVVSSTEAKVEWQERGGTQRWEFEMTASDQLVQRGFLADGGKQFFELVLQRQD